MPRRSWLQSGKIGLPGAPPMSGLLRGPAAQWPAKRTMAFVEILSNSLISALRWLLRRLFRQTWLRQLQAPAGEVSYQEKVRHVTSPGSPKTWSTWLRCDSNFVITEVQLELCKLLRYEPESLIGRSVLVLMPSVVSEAHASLFRRLQAMPGWRREALLGHASRCRDAVILDSEGAPLPCRLTVNIHADLSSKLVFESVRGKIAQCVPRGFGQFLRQPAAPHIIDCQEVACIMTDVANTTRFATSQTPRMMAELLHQVYVTANAVVQREAHPYVYIHEAVGDSLLLLCNAEFMARYPGRTASIAIYVAAKVQRAVDEMLSAFADGDHGMYLRTGVALGPLCAGVVDGRNFRVFGSTIHLSQRLESVCPRSRIACCKNFTTQLLDEVKEADFNLVPAAVDLKGFGTVEYSVVDFLGSSLPGQQEKGV
ncbi:npr2 [Symbiodinium pilosum]|uniref:Npr2 protein n=1 Tax=Symbiodinium pilosum TaxID=2952 RepID=A0A812UFF5_SYMPI|nr:npr2 [Symbiodinium pilosum]